MLDPARTVIEICGGVMATAKMAGRNRSTVYRWGLDDEMGGTGGEVPRSAKKALLDSASDVGIDLRPEHFAFAPCSASLWEAS